MKHLLLLLYILITFKVYSQKVEFSVGTNKDMPVETVETTFPHTQTDPIYENPPQFPGGLDSLNHYFAKNGKISNLSSGGQIFVAFVVREDGLTEEVEIIKSFDNQKCNEEVIRLIEHMPEWIPAEFEGHKISMKMILPILVEIK